MNTTFPAGFRYTKKKKKPLRRKTRKHSPRPSTSHGSRGNVSPTTKKPNIERKYILNLQQQISFLEMELDLQKKVSEEIEARKKQGSENLDEPLEQLRVTYIQKSKEQEKAIDKLHENLESLQVMLETETKKNAELNNRLLEKDEIGRKEDLKERQILVQNMVHKDGEIEELKLKVQSMSEYEEKLSNDIKNLQHEKHQEMQKTDEIRNLLVERDAEIKKLTLENEKLSNLAYKNSGQVKDIAQETHDRIKELEKKVMELENENRRCMFDVKTSELEVEKEKASKEHLNMKISKELLPNMIDLQAEIKTKQETILKLTEENGKTNERLKSYVREKSAIDSKYVPLLEEIKDLQVFIEDLKKKNIELGNEENELKIKQREHDNEMEKRFIEIVNLKQFIKNEEMKTEKLKIDTRSNNQKVLESDEKFMKVQAMVELYKKKITELEVENDSLQKKLKIQNLIELLNKSDLRNLVASTSSITGTVNQLLDEIKE